MRTPRSHHAAVRLLDGRVLVVGGSRPGPTDLDSGLTSAELYDPNSGTWSATGDTANPLLNRHAATLLRDGKVLVVVQDGAEVYDPEAGLDRHRETAWVRVSRMATRPRSATASAAGSRVLAPSCTTPTAGPGPRREG